MARKSKNTVDYFPHDCTHGRKMYIVESQFGNDGYAVWFKLLEQLGLAEDHYLDLRDYSQMMFLSSYCKVDEDTFKSILDLLCKIGAINKFLWEKDIIFSDKFIDSVQEAYKRRNNECITFSDLCKHLGFKCKHNDDNKRLNDSEKPQIKEKEIKVNKTKENKSSLKGLHLFSSSPYYDIEKFKSKFENTDYQYADLNFYYEAVKNWADSKGEKKKDWIATARNFMLRDKKDDKLQLANNVNNESNGKPTDEERLEFWKRVHGEI